ncbi:DUF11 domain-containing protein [Embleya sp. NBC_00896]|uniref:DUF11 domain-containing protein n=1 Tax=Embleya sp. NBC_00896 TaxID=2975961 RepID=UPI003864AFCA|nr:DUF11 domain-containing protein [Embleya sp. NBC_00896]
MMRAKTRVRRTLAAVTVGVTTAMGVNLAAAGTAQAAPERRPAPRASAYGWSPWSSASMWSSSRVVLPPDDVMADLRGQVDEMRGTVGQELQDALADMMATLAASLPPGVPLPNLPDLSDLGVVMPTVTSPTRPAAPPPPVPVTPPKPPVPPVPPKPPIDPTATVRLELRRAADRAQAKPGDVVTHTVTVRNGGTADATSAVVRNTVPAGVKLMDSKPSQGEFDTATGLWKTGSIKAGSAVTLILVLKVPEGAAGSEMTARSSFVTAPGAKPVIGNACSDDTTATCAGTRVAESS